MRTIITLGTAVIVTLVGTGGVCHYFGDRDLWWIALPIFGGVGANQAVHSP